MAALKFSCVAACLCKQTSPSWLANYTKGKRRFDSYATAADALDAAGKLARQLSERDVLTAPLTRAQAIHYASAVQSLNPHNVSLPAAASTLSECLKQVGGLPDLHAAVKFYLARHVRRLPERIRTAVASAL